MFVSSYLGVVVEAAMMYVAIPDPIQAMHPPPDIGKVVHERDVRPHHKSNAENPARDEFQPQFSATARFNFFVVPRLRLVDAIPSPTAGPTKEKHFITTFDVVLFQRTIALGAFHQTSI